MLRRGSIAFKIFGLSLLLLAFMVVLSIVNTSLVQRIEGQLEELRNIGQPLSTTLADLDMCGARRRIAFERLGRGYADSTQEGPLQEALINHAYFDALADTLIDKAEGILADSDAIVEINADVLRELRKDLVDMRAAFHGLGDLQKKMLVAYANGDTAGVGTMEAVHARAQTAFQDRRAHLRILAEELASDMSTRVTEEHRLVVITSIALTSIAVLLGLLVAWALTLRMVRPVRSLMAGIGRVEKGDLHVRLPVTSHDEIGQLTGSFNRMVHELEGKQALKETFGRYVDPRLIDRLVATRDQGMPGSDRHEMTVAFADLVGYTSLSTAIAPHDLVRLLNAHFSAMSEVLHEHNAVVDKFIGDAVMAYWGPPFVTEQRHAIEACASALALVQRFDRFLLEDLPTIVDKDIAKGLGLCIGIATGEMIVGNIGSDRAMSWTVIGEAVNLASRLESLNRQHGTRILVSERTHELASSVIRFREVGEVGVKGYDQRLRIFEAVDFLEAAG